MAARIRKLRNDEETRLKIQSTQLIKRLTAHVLGTIEMVPSQVTAALGLLRKTVPDLSAVEHSGEIATHKVIRSPAIASDTPAWSKEHGLNGGSQAKH